MVRKESVWKIKELTKVQTQTKVGELPWPGCNLEIEEFATLQSTSRQYHGICYNKISLRSLWRYTTQMYTFFKANFSRFQQAHKVSFAG